MNTRAEIAMNVHVSELPPTGAIEVSGNDARAFLQGQLTSDIRKLDRQTSQLSAWCNPQGRVITTLRVVDLGESLQLLLPLDQVQHVSERMRRFVLRADVRIAAHDEPMMGVGIQGSTVRTLLHEAGLQPLTAVNAVEADDASVLVRVAGPEERYELYGRDVHDKLRTLLTDNVIEDADHPWRAGNIEAGLPVVYAATRERFLPQMLNLDVLQAVSFTKGCYAGQEIVARTQNLGRVKRRMLRLAGRFAPQAGSPIHAGDDEAGAVIEAARTRKRVELLAVIRLDCSSGPLTAPGDTLPLERLELPYALPPADGPADTTDG